MKLMGKFKLERYVTKAGVKPVDTWLNAQELSVNARIESRFFNVERGCIGDHRHVGGDIWELKFHFGPGYRVYVARDGDKLVLLLLYAGIKGTQKKDIKKAHEYWQDFLSRREHEKAK
jgi:putative addiction module killer protein